MTELDVSRAPRGVIAATALIRSLENEDDRVERHYLELKGTLDLNSRRDAAKVAKFILGAANRPIPVAQTAFEGAAAMVIGISDGKAVGIPPIEPMELARTVERYVGVATVSPRWDVVRVAVPDSGQEVLIVLVEPPAEGQPMYLCLANGDGVSDGAIYMRADGETRQATAEEIKALLQRAAASDVPQIELAVDVNYSPYAVTIDLNTAVNDYITAVKARLFEPEDDELVATGSGLSTAVISAASRPENRSREAYTTEIRDWEVNVREAVRSAPAELVGQLLPPVVVTVANNSDAFLREVELKIHLEGDITGAEYDHADSISDISLPLPPIPRRWGRRPNPAFNINLPPLLSGLPSQPSFPTYSPSRTTWDNSGSVTISLDIGDLRPRGSVELDEEELVLWLPGETHSETVTNGTWTITAVDHHRVFSGTLQLRPAKHADLTGLLRELLSMRTPSASKEH